jgi:hypothetical protein
MRCVSRSLPLLLLAAVSCEKGGHEDPNAVASPLRFDTPDAATDARFPAVGCVPGKHRCVGEKLEACDPAHGGWTQVNVCQSAAHCNGMMKQCLVDPCVLGEYQCDGPVLQRCSANGWSDVRTCPSAAACDATNGTCRS